MYKMIDIKYYEGDYLIDNKGGVFSLLSNKYLKKHIGTSGYYFVNLKNKSHFIHQLMAINFLSHKPCGQQIVVDHIDNNKLNNDLCNLQLISQRLNSTKDKINFTGCFYVKATNKWGVRPRYKGVKIFLGYYECLEYAKWIYNDFVKRADSNKYTIEELKELKEVYRKKISKMK